MPTTGFDHAVLVYPSIEAAETMAERLGFTTAPRAIHPFGTGNVLVQFDDHNLEFLAVLDDDKAAADRPDAFSFARFNRNFLARNGPGFAMTVVKMTDEAASAEHFAEAGFIAEHFGFSRAAKAPDGTDATVSFRTLFAEAPLLTDAGLFACQHLHTPDLFYKPAYQSHPNTATGVTGVLMAALEPATVAATLARAAGGRHETARFGDAVAFGPDVFEVLAPDAIREAYGIGCHVPSSGLRHVAVRVAVADMDALRRVLEANGVAADDQGERLVVLPEAGGGTGFIFEPGAR